MRMTEAEYVAREWVRTDPYAARRDAQRLGPEGAAEHWLLLASDQPYWSGALTYEGALAVAAELADQLQ